jgi:hypothetical protein
MTPTPKLRFVERVIAVPATDGEGRKVIVLQQWWEESIEVASSWGRLPQGEWRDIRKEIEQ